MGCSPPPGDGFGHDGAADVGGGLQRPVDHARTRRKRTSVSPPGPNRISSRRSAAAALVATRSQFAGGVLAQPRQQPQRRDQHGERQAASRRLSFSSKAASCSVVSGRSSHGRQNRARADGVGRRRGVVEVAAGAAAAGGVSLASPTWSFAARR
jgi:hypothetical protein